MDPLEVTKMSAVLLRTKGCLHWQVTPKHIGLSAVSALSYPKLQQQGPLLTPLNCISYNQAGLLIFANFHVNLRMILFRI